MIRIPRSDTSHIAVPGRIALLLILAFGLGACGLVVPKGKATKSVTKSPVVEGREQLKSAKEALKQRKHDTVIAILDRVIASHALAGPDLAQAYYYRGRAFSRLRRPTRARGNYTAAIQVDPRYGDAYRSRCHINLVLGYTYDAANDCRMALSLDPQSARAYAARAMLNSKLGHFAAALADHDKAISLTPQNWILLFNRGLTHREMSNEDLARQDITAAFEKSAAWARTSEPYAKWFRHYGLIQ